MKNRSWNYKCDISDSDLQQTQEQKKLDTENKACLNLNILT